MKTAKLTLMCLACAAAIPAIAQNTTDSRCGMTNYDSSRNVFTIVRPTSGTPNQQCFITVVSKQSWAGGMPDLTSSQLVEGNYEVAVSGGGGGGGGGGAGRETEHGRTGIGTGGEGGGSAIPVTTVRYLNPGVYRLTIGSGGQGGASNGGHGADGAPTSLSNAYSNETVAGFSRAESWDGSYSQNSLADNSGGTGLTAVAYTPETAPKGGERGADGGGGNVAEAGGPGGNGFIRIALKDPPPPAASTQTGSAPAYVAPADTSAPIAPAEIVAPVRPARRDRN